MISERKFYLRIILLFFFVFFSLRLNPFSSTDLIKAENYELNYTFCKEEKETSKIAKSFKKKQKAIIAYSNKNITKTKEDFVIFAMKTSIEVEKKYKTNAIVQCAQLIIESYYGLSTLAKKANNLTGIKCYSDITSIYWKGDYIRMDDDRPKEKFKKYSSFRNSIFDYGLFLTSNPRYSKCLGQKDYKKVISEIKAAGYATSKRYCKDLETAIKDNDLINLYNTLTHERTDSLSVVVIPNSTIQ